MAVFVFMSSVKELSSTAALLVVVALGVSYLLARGLLIPFYRSQNVRRIFEAKDANSYWIESLPIPVLVLAVLFAFYAIAMHVPLFFNGVFPLFGIWLSDIQGVVALDISIAGLAFLTLGLLRRRAWAWWGSVGYFGLLTFSSVATLVQSSLSEILSVLRLLPTEAGILEGVPLQGARLAALIGIPLIVTLGVIVVSRRYFDRQV
ncbi:MAG: hypothetical protein NUW23_14330 [Firmicutes bacterium]|jgi:hypothetical protein|nr:hypothetical protein [Bacillota bacterium]